MTSHEILNETIEKIGQTTFDKAFEVTSSPEFIIAVLIVWAVPLIIYVIWGALSQSRTSSGVVLSSKAISNPNFWVAFLIWAIFQGALMLLLIFPIWILAIDKFV